MVELIVNGQALELENKGSNINYTKQIADIFNIASVSTSYTNSFVVPKTPKNTQILQQLGLVGDTSSMPYQKVPVRLNNNGFSIIASGWLDIKSTSDSYKMNIINGMIDFFKAIENKTLGIDLDLSIFDHEKTLETVIASFDNENYKYLLADYNGKNFGETSDDVQGINIDYLIPSFSVKKLWDMIFSTYGFTYDIADIPFINGLYITYPKPPQDDATPELIAEFTKGNYTTSQVADGGGYIYPYLQEFWATSNVIEGQLVNNWQFIVPESGTYVFEFTTEAYFKPIFDLARPAIMSIISNGSYLSSAETDPLAPVTRTHLQNLNTGDVIQLRLFVAGSPQGAFHHNSTIFKISKLDLGDVSLTNAFEDFSIRDFVKEILWRTGLTPVKEEHTNHIRFVKLSDRLNFSNAIDWSNKYIKRTDETYTLSGYAQKNRFALKHNNEDDISGDGYLYVNNRNISDEKVIVSSKIYAPELTAVTFNNLTTDLYRVWNRETKVNQNGIIEVEYKGLSNRFYFLRYKTEIDTFTLVSEYLDTSGSVTSIPYATNEDTLFDELVFKNYDEYKGVLFNFRRHVIELAITERDIIELDMTIPFYFKQEGQYYMLNKLTYQEGRTTTGEFIRINKL